MVTAKAALLVAIIAMGTGVVGWGIPSAGSSCSPLCDHARFTVQFSLSGSPSKYSLDADPNLVTGLANTTARQGQFPASVNLYVWYVWCDTTVSGGKLVLQQTGGGAGSLVCYIGINPVVSGSNCRLDLSGGSFTTMGSPDSTVNVCTIAGNTSFAWESVASNTDTTPHLISGVFVVSIY